MREILRIAETDMTRARRKSKKRIAAALITAMAETDSDYEFIAKRLGDVPGNIEKFIAGLIAGETRCYMDEVSDLLLAMGCEFEFRLHRSELQQSEEQPQQAEAAA